MKYTPYSFNGSFANEYFQLHVGIILIICSLVKGLKKGGSERGNLNVVVCGFALHTPDTRYEFKDMEGHYVMCKHYNA